MNNKSKHKRTIWFLAFLLSLSFNSFSQDAFITKWVTDDGEIEIITSTVSYTYNYDISWKNLTNPGVGEGSETGLTNDYTISGLSNGDTIQVEIAGTFPRFRAYMDANKLIDVSQWGTIKWKSMSYSFDGCNNLKISASDTPDLSQCTTMSNMFRRAKNFNEDISHWDVSAVTDMTSMFSEATAFNQNLNTWNVSAVTAMGAMFSEASAFNQSLSNWNVSSVTNMGQMFSYATAFNQDLSNWNVASVTNMYQMFYRATSFNGMLNNWNLSAIVYIDGIFNGASAFNQDLSTWNVSNITDMSYMFSGASSFNQDISGWNVSSVIDMSSMFSGAKAFNQDLSSWNVSAVADMGAMFSSAIVFNQNIGSWNVSAVTNMSYMFDNATVFNQDISSWNVSAVTTMSNMFKEASAFNQNIGAWNVSAVTSMKNMFYKATAFTHTLSTWDVSSVTNMSWMFAWTGKVNVAPGNWDVSAVTTMDNMFYESSMLVNNYNAALINWAKLTLQNGVLFNAGTSKYSSLATASKQTIVDTYSWVISDGGLFTSSNAPVITSAATVNVAENEKTVITITSSDADANDNALYSITGGSDEASFNLDTYSGELVFIVDNDFETPADSDANNEFVVEITATDAGGLTATQTLTVTITDETGFKDNIPVFTSANTVSIEENQTTVHTVTASDADAGDTRTYSISGGTDKSLFSIDANGGALSFKTAPDFELPIDANKDNDYVVEVTVTDAGSLTAVQSITVSVTDVVEGNAPVITSSNTVNAEENQTTVITVTATDADTDDTQAYSISGGADMALFTIDATTGELTFINAPDYNSPTDADANNEYIVEVTVTDAGGLTATQTITVTVTDVVENVAPVITSADTVSVEENQKTVITVTASDANIDDTHTFSIVGGSDMNKFAIDNSTGVLSFNVAPDYENPFDSDANNIYMVKVAVADNGGLTASQTISITITDVAENTAPFFTSSNTVTIEENQTDVLVVTASDNDANDTQAFFITAGDDMNLFSIDASSGQLSFKLAPDYETPKDSDKDNVYNITITVIDSGSLTANQNLSITVSDVSETSAPVFTSANTITVPENQTTVITVTATDSDADETLAYSITGGADKDLFSINETTGELSFITAPDYEAPADNDGTNVYVLVVTATDSGGLTATQTILVTVSDVDENTAPSITSSNTISIEENQTAVITLTISDTDADDTHTFSITGGDDMALFSIDAATGELSFITAPNYNTPADADENNEYIVEVTVTDAGGLTATQTIAISITAIVGISDYQSSSLNVNTYPNPVIDVVNVNYTLEKAGSIQIELYDLNGMLVEQIFAEEQAIGAHKVKFNIAHLQSGIYSTVIITNNGTAVSKLIKY